MAVMGEGQSWVGMKAGTSAVELYSSAETIRVIASRCPISKGQEMPYFFQSNQRHSLSHICSHTCVYIPSSHHHRNARGNVNHHEIFDTTTFFAETPFFCVSSPNCTLRNSSPTICGSGAGTTVSSSSATGRNLRQM